MKHSPKHYIYQLVDMLQEKVTVLEATIRTYSRELERYQKDDSLWAFNLLHCSPEDIVVLYRDTYQVVQINRNEMTVTMKLLSKNVETES